jgi:hypothetical protein
MTCYRSANHWICPAEPSEHERHWRNYILGEHYINLTTDVLLACDPGKR